jgi:hypothetical protein
MQKEKEWYLVASHLQTEIAPVVRKPANSVFVQNIYDMKRNLSVLKPLPAGTKNLSLSRLFAIKKRSPSFHYSHTLKTTSLLFRHPNLAKTPHPNSLTPRLRNWQKMISLNFHIPQPRLKQFKDPLIPFLSKPRTPPPPPNTTQRKVQLRMRQITSKTLSCSRSEGNYVFV